MTEDEESEKLVEAVEEALVAEESDDALVDAQLANEPETESQFFPSTSSFFPSTSFGVFPSYGFPSFGFQGEYSGELTPLPVYLTRVISVMHYDNRLHVTVF